MGKSNLRVRDIGEFDLIRHLAGMLPHRGLGHDGILIGIGDDTALWRPNPDQDVAITTDALVEGIHFRLDWTDWTSLGHKMLAVNLSDIAAMGAVPRLATIVLGLTGDELVTDIESLYVGAGTLAAAYDTAIAGGDIVRSPAGLMLSVTLVGSVARGAEIRRSGAGIGDLVVVSGTIGASAAGMTLLERGDDRSATGPLLVATHLRPTPRVALGQILHGHGVTAAMDVSDGLLGDLPRILDASAVGAEIELTSLPILPAVRALFPDRAETFALRGGEDYELLMTVPEDRFRALRDAARDLAATLTPIGRIVERGDTALALLRNGEHITAAAGAFDHFG